MNEVLPTKNNVERLGRRIETYRAHHNESAVKHDVYQQSIAEEQRENTTFLKQRFLDSKSKKVKKDHRTYKESVAETSKSQVAKPPAKRPIEDPVFNGLPQNVSSDENDRPAKISRTDNLSEKLLEIQSTQSSTNSSVQNLQSSSRINNIQSLSAQIVQQVNQHPQLDQNNVLVQNIGSNISFTQQSTSNNLVEVVNTQDENSQSSSLNHLDANSKVDFKKENENDSSDMVPLEALQPSNLQLSNLQSDSSSDMMSIETYQDILGDISPLDQIEFQNEFFEVDGSIKNINKNQNVTVSNAEEVTCPFSSTAINQQLNVEMPRSLSCGDESISLSSNTSISSPLPFSQPTLKNCMPVNFKLDESSNALAAQALKQMAEQHQSSQHQHMLNSTICSRPSFTPILTENCLPSPINNGSLNFHNRNVLQGNDKLPNTSSNIYPFDNLPEELFSTVPNSCSRNANFDSSHLQMPVANQFDIQKPPPYSTTRPLSHYNENGQSKLQVNNHHLHSPSVGKSKIQHNSDMRFQFNQSQQSGHLHSINVGPIRDGENKMTPRPNLLNNFSDIKFPPLPQTVSKPPPEYKPPQNLPANLNVDQLNVAPQPLFSQINKNNKVMKNLSPSVNIATEGLAVPSVQNWRLNSSNLQQPSQLYHQQAHIQNHMNNYVRPYGNLHNNVRPGGPLSPSYNQFRPVTTHVLPNQRPNIMPPMVMQQRPQNISPQCQRSPMVSVDSSICNNNSANSNTVLPSGPFNGSQDIINRNNNSINLDLFEVEELFNCIS